MFQINRFFFFQLKANLRSVLTLDDEELEVIPHVKGSTDFEVYEQVVIAPKRTILPWDDNVKPNYTMAFKVLFSLLELLLFLQHQL